MDRRDWQNEVWREWGRFWRAAYVVIVVAAIPLWVTALLIALVWG